MNGLRQYTVFLPCAKHRRFFTGERRARVAEFFAEGGPAGSACDEAGACRVRPGRDLFIAALCQRGITYRTDDLGPFHWSANDRTGDVRPQPAR